MACIGIRREDKNKWERRVAITPSQVKDLVSKGIKVIVQPSAIRVFKDVEYEQVGAIVQEDMSEAKTIFCVKEIPIEMIEEGKQYVMFSHTIKAQDYNMSLLDKFLEKNARLVDYECITRDGKRGSPRTVAFGRFAGLAGAIDFIRGMGERFLALGYATPFLHMGSAFMYEDLEAAKEAVKTVGELISNFGLPEALCPFNAVLTAHGLVSKGAQEILKLLPHKMVSPNEFKALVEGKDAMTKEERCHQIFIAESLPQHLVQPKDAGEEFVDFDMFHYFKNPEQYKPVFHERVAPYATVLFNVMYWDPKYPRVLTTEQYRNMVKEDRSRLLGVCDISCDFEGSVEMLKYFSHIEEPFWLYDVETDGVKKTLEGEGLFFHTVDHLPSELPREASNHFGSCLAENLLDLCTAEKLADLSEVMQGAVICDEGKLTSNFEYIADMRAVNEANTKTDKRILLIGCGLVTPPLVEYLSRRKENKITACSMVYEEAVKLCAGRDNMTPMLFNIATESEKLGELVAQHDIALSLLPAQFHPVVARECIKHKKHMATASYISPDMAKLSKQVEDAGILIINEVGVDPGIDHMSALQIIDDVKAKGGKINGFSSLCGGLAAPECADNPLGYKFSWAPRGVLTAGTNTARFLEDSKEVNIQGKDLLSSAKPCYVNPAFNLEVIPNRDSVPYVELYGLEGIQSMFRGTLRYGGYCEKMSSLCKLGMFSLDTIAKEDMSWKEFMATMILDCEVDKVVDTTKAKLNMEPAVEERVLSFMKWLGIITDKAIVPAVTRLDVLANLMANMEDMQFVEGERDMVLMHHDFDIELADGKKEKITSTMVEYSDNEGRTAMSRTVGITCAIATQMILDGDVTKPGVHAPLTPEWYNPILKALDGENIRLKEKRISM